MARNKKRIALGSADDNLANGFASLLKKEGFTATQEDASPEVNTGASLADVADAEDASLWRVRIERKGRKGKTVTLLLGVQNLQAQKKRLQKKLGCGVSIEGETLVLQGDHQQSIKAMD